MGEFKFGRMQYLRQDFQGFHDSGSRAIKEMMAVGDTDPAVADRS